MNRFGRRAVVTAALVAVPLLAASPALAAKSDAGSHRSHHHTRPAAAPVTPSTDEAEVVRLTNIERAKAGCGPLHIDNRLVAAARAHSADMTAKNFFSHTGSNGSDFVAREQAAGYPRTNASAENIAFGYGTAAEVVDGWMHSEGHRRNILDCTSTAVGVGLSRTASGTPYWTQDFGRV